MRKAGKRGGWGRHKTKGNEKENKPVDNIHTVKVL